MKYFEEMIQKVLKEREELEKKQQKLAEDIIDIAINVFADISVKSVRIEIDSSTNKEIAFYLGEEKKGGFTHLIYGKNVFNMVEDILLSKDSKISQSFHISMDSERIVMELKENAWMKKGGIFLPFSFI